jgi:hypothetical protein
LEITHLAFPLLFITTFNPCLPTENIKVNSLFLILSATIAENRYYPLCIFKMLYSSSCSIIPTFNSPQLDYYHNWNFCPYLPGQIQFSYYHNRIKLVFPTAWLSRPSYTHTHTRTHTHTLITLLNIHTPHPTG